MSGGRTGGTPPRVEGLYGILDPSVVAVGAKDPEEALDAAVAEAIAGGCRVIQYRDRQASPWKVLSRAKRLAAACERGGALFLVNDRLDIALLSGARGCHLGPEDLPLPEARRIVPQGFLLGASTRDVVDARKAERDGADYVGVDAIFRTMAASDAPEPRGPKIVAELASSLSIPVIAISGITRGNLREVIRAGASGFALVSDLFGGPGVRERSEEFLRIWEEERSRR